MTANNKPPINQAGYRSGFIAIIGRPNVGKSTLLNQILKDKIAIVSDKPQTTRNRILGVKNLPGSQMVFLDTPGIHKPRYKMNRRMVNTALGTLEEVNLIFFIIDAKDAVRAHPGGALLGAGDRYIMDSLKELKTPVFMVPNKMDLLEKEKILPFMEECARHYNYAEVIPISAMDDDNVDCLEAEAKKYLPEGRPIFPPDVITDQPVRFIASEFIREKILRYTWEEIPYSVAVLIDEFIEEPKQPVHIRATILVERDSQKGIVIGKRGEMLKKVGTEARLELEKLLGEKVFLELWVKVQKDWRQSEPVLTELGY